MSRFPATAKILVAAACAGHGCANIPDADYVNTYHATDAARDQEPAVATDGFGNWVTVWASQHPLGALGTDWDMFHSYSRSEGRQWTDVTPLNTAAAADGKFGEVYPTIAFGPRTGVVLWSSGNDQSGTVGADLDIRVARTPGLPLGGWSADQFLHAPSAAADGDDDDSYPDVATDGQGRWVAVWIRSGLADADILTSRSLDDGLTWSAPKALNHDAASDAEDDLSPSIASDGAGRWIALWSHQSGDASKTPIRIAISNDDGATWSTAKPLRAKAFGFQPRIIHAGKTWLAAWTSHFELTSSGATEPNIHVSRSMDGGKTWSAPAYLNSDWNDTSGLGIWGHQDLHVDVASDGKGNWIAVWDLWLATTLTASDVRVAYSSDDGVTWSKPHYLNPGWDSETVSERYPRIATDGSGNWVVVSELAAHVAGNTAEDADVRVHRIRFPSP